MFCNAALYGYGRPAVPIAIINHYEDVIYMRLLLSNMFKTNPKTRVVILTKISTGLFICLHPPPPLLFSLFFLPVSN